MISFSPGLSGGQRLRPGPEVALGPGLSAWHTVGAQEADDQALGLLSNLRVGELMRWL